MRPGNMLTGLRRWRYDRRMAGPKLLRAFARAHPDAFFIEIGSNDGEKHDHLRRFVLSHDWRGIMVEPVPYVFERLRRNYGHLDRVDLANVAITGAEGELPFYHLPEADDPEGAGLPEWYDAIGSFSREAVLGHRTHIPDIESRILESNVRCVTFDSLLRQHSVEQVDLVLVDTEGHDAEIVSQIYLREVRPELLIYEHFHLPRETREALRHHLHESGYQTMEEHFDTFCLASDAPASLLRLWRTLRPGLPGISAEDEAR